MFRNFTITDGTRVLIASAFAYALAYVFLYSYLAHFGVSSLAISITIPDLVVSIAGLLIMLFCLDQLAELWRELEPSLRKNHPVAKLVREGLRGTFGIGVIVLLIYGLSGVVVWLLFVAPT
ncbi:hypothetical protein RAAC3_TM7C00001G0953 [Candidatus Saccharibacteria bacterium RAAC3_TM7_1]|nr:hypothetical protein RAAC3_TM7C00001G0953 [Candidatus Saccharibacteria bacterium RAAC3_TM7_1]